MKRRHLFDKGYPVCTATLLAGSQVLLAVSNQSLRRSCQRLALSLVALANSAERRDPSRACITASAGDLRVSREKYGRLGHAARVEITA